MSADGRVDASTTGSAAGEGAMSEGDGPRDATIAQSCSHSDLKPFAAAMVGGMVVASICVRLRPRHPARFCAFRDAVPVGAPEAWSS